MSLKKYVHFTSYGLDVARRSMSLSRLSGSLEARKARNSSSCGIRPVRSMCMRRKNSSSDDNDACGTPSFSIFPKMNSSMRFFRGMGVDPSSPLEGRSCSVRSDTVDLLFEGATGGWSFGNSGTCALRVATMDRNKHPRPNGRMRPPLDGQLLIGSKLIGLIVGRSNPRVNVYVLRNSRLIP